MLVGSTTTRKRFGKCLHFGGEEITFVNQAWVWKIFVLLSMEFMIE
jgi:hypothetical protein